MYVSTAPFHGFVYSGAGEGEARAEFVLSRVGEGGDGLIVEVGAGTGNLSFAIARRGTRVVALEESPALFAILLERFRGARECWPVLSPLPINFSALPAELSARAIVASNLMSHLAPLQKKIFLEECVRRLRASGGTLIFNCVQASPQRPTQGRSEILKRVYGENILRHFAASEPSVSGAEDVVVTSEIILEHRGIKIKSFSDQTSLYFDDHNHIEQNLRMLGINSCAITGGWSDTPYQTGGPAFVVVAQVSPDEGRSV